MVSACGSGFHRRARLRDDWSCAPWMRSAPRRLTRSTSSRCAPQQTSRRARSTTTSGPSWDCTKSSGSRWSDGPSTASQGRWPPARTIRRRRSARALLVGFDYVVDTGRVRLMGATVPPGREDVLEAAVRSTLDPRGAGARGGSRRGGRRYVHARRFQRGRYAFGAAPIQPRRPLSPGGDPRDEERDHAADAHDVVPEDRPCQSRLFHGRRRGCRAEPHSGRCAAPPASIGNPARIPDVIADQRGPAPTST